MQRIIQPLCAETHLPQFLCVIRFLRQDHQDQVICRCLYIKSLPINLTYLL